MNVNSSRSAFRALVALALCVSALSCGGDGNSQPPTAPTPTAPTPSLPSPPAPTVSGPLPYGQAIGGGVLPCPSGPPAGSTCSGLLVTCPGVDGASATLRVTRPASLDRGTVILTTGGGHELSGLTSHARDDLLARGGRPRRRPDGLEPTRHLEQFAVTDPCVSLCNGGQVDLREHPCGR